jgi:AcrR family transcriptional regulator
MTKINDTKQKILDVALKLFGAKGYEGTSVRDIAKEADVNLASVNYHFTNKQNLYFEVFNDNCISVEKSLEALYRENMSLCDFSIEIFNYFLENDHTLLNTFRLILNESIDFSLKDTNSVCTDKLGPPAANTLLKLVTEEVGEDVPFDGRFWVVTTLSAQITHAAIIMSSSVIKERCSRLEHLNKPTQIRNIKLTCQALISLVKVKPYSEWDKDFKIDV